MKLDSRLAPVLVLVLGFCMGSPRAALAERFEPPPGMQYYGIGQVLSSSWWAQAEPAIDGVASRSCVSPTLVSEYMGVTSNISTVVTRYRNLKTAEDDPFFLLLAPHFHDQVENLLNGVHDQTLRNWGAYLKDHPEPVFIRPLYEINCGDHGSAHIAPFAATVDRPFPEVAIEAYRRVVDKVREGAGGELSNVAWMWHVIPQAPGSSCQGGYSVEDFYPGDDYVNWIGVSWFSRGAIEAMRYVDPIASAHAKPVMVAESGPSEGAGVFEANVIPHYFQAYFDRLRDSPHVKGFVHINWDWTTVDWLDWPNFKLEAVPSVLDYFARRTREVVNPSPCYDSRPGAQSYWCEDGPMGNARPVPGDYDGNGLVDPGLWREGKTSSFRLYPEATVTETAWGTTKDVPVPGDYDGDGKTDIAVWRGSDTKWYVKRSSNGASWVVPWGSAALGDIPVPADYDGDGKTDIAVWRPTDSKWYIRFTQTGASYVFAWGSKALGDIPVPADYDGDGKADIAVWRGNDAKWYVKRSSNGTSWVVPWGSSALRDVPVPADYDGDGRADLAVWRPTDSKWYVRYTASGKSHVLAWGSEAHGDIPVPADYDGDGKADIAVWRESANRWFVTCSH